MMERGVGDTHICLSRHCFIVRQFQVCFLFFCFFLSSSYESCRSHLASSLGRFSQGDLETRRVSYTFSLSVPTYFLVITVGSLIAPFFFSNAVSSLLRINNEYEISIASF